METSPATRRDVILSVHHRANRAIVWALLIWIGSVAGGAFYQAIAPLYPGMSVAPDWPLGLLFGLGGMAGMYLGARCQKFVPARVIKGMLSGILVLTALKYGAAFFGW